MSTVTDTTTLVCVGHGSGEVRCAERSVASGRPPQEHPSTDSEITSTTDTFQPVCVEPGLTSELTPVRSTPSLVARETVVCR